MIMITCAINSRHIMIDLSDLSKNYTVDNTFKNSEKE
jgi:hypothetical protein